MKTTKLILASLLCVMLVATVSCKKNANKSQTNTQTAMADNSENSLDWAGIYTGVIPCADCEGIQTTLVLNQNKTYKLSTKYLGKSHDVYTLEGSFTWDSAGSEIALEGLSAEESPSKYVVGENKLIQKNLQGERMAAADEGKYTLVKVSDIVEKYWKLIEINGKEVVTGENQVKEAHMILKVGNNRVNGNGGCNSFNGSYVIENGNRIKFSQMASTMMACLNMDVESQFMKALENADNYAIQGDTLSINRARMAPLARFVVVYL